jgi:hypothetical protein
MDLRAEVIIHAPAPVVWAVLGERFGQISQWAAPITSSALAGPPGVGAVRTCHIAGFGPIKPGAIKERLIAFDPEARSFTYAAIDGLPGFVKRAINRWSVHARGERLCLVRTHAALELRGPMRSLGFYLERRLQADGSRALDELRHYIEEGRPHPRKLRAVAQAIESE